MANQKAIIISAFPCTGKSYLGKIYNNVIDLETTYFQYELTQEQKQLTVEQLKGTRKTQRDNWQEDYLKEVKRIASTECILLIAPSRKIRQLLTDNSLEYILVYPEKGLGEEYASRAASRGNGEHFVERIRTTLDQQIEEDYLADKDAVKHIALKSSEYLTDALEKEGVLNSCVKKGDSVK